MTFDALLEKYDEHYPNAIPDSVKLDWANEIEGMVCAELNKNYALVKTLVTPSCPIITLPDGVSADDVEVIILNGKRITKADLRSHDIIGFLNTVSFRADEPLQAEVVYIVNHTPVEALDSDFENLVFEKDTITFAKSCPLKPGDRIEITNCKTDTNNTTTTVLLSSEDTVWVDAVFDDYSGSAHIKRVLDKELRASFPYDKLYLEYLIAKGDLYNRDFDAYRNDMIIFNTTWMSYARYLKQRASQNLSSQFKNYW